MRVEGTVFKNAYSILFTLLQLYLSVRSALFTVLFVSLFTVVCGCYISLNLARCQFLLLYLAKLRDVTPLEPRLCRPTGVTRKLENYVPDRGYDGT